MNEQLTAREVHDIVQELRGADYHTVGQEFFDTRIKRLNDAGWKLGVTSFPLRVTHGRRGHLLRRPKNEWRNLAYFYNTTTMVKVWYWNNAAITKADALYATTRTPAPTGNYVTFDLNVNNKWETTK